MAVCIGTAYCKNAQNRCYDKTTDDPCNDFDALPVSPPTDAGLVPTEAPCYALFAAYSPCIYFGKILCKDCDRHKDCDMEMGRTLHQDCYVAGYLAGSGA